MNMYDVPESWRIVDDRPPGGEAYIPLPTRRSTVVMPSRRADVVQRIPRRRNLFLLDHGWRLLTSVPEGLTGANRGPAVTYSREQLRTTHLPDCLTINSGVAREPIVGSSSYVTFAVYFDMNNNPVRVSAMPTRPGQPSNVEVSTGTGGFLTELVIGLWSKQRPVGYLLPSLDSAPHLRNMKLEPHGKAAIECGVLAW